MKKMFCSIFLCIIALLAQVSGTTVVLDTPDVRWNAWYNMEELGGPLVEWGTSIQANKRGNGFVGVGYINGSKILAMRFDTTGARLWLKEFSPGDLGKTGSPSPYVNTFVLSADNGFIIPVTFANDSSIAILRLDSIGTKLWQTNYTAGQNLQLAQMVLTPDSGCILVGSASNKQKWYLKDAIIAKFDNRGNKTWEKRFTRAQGANGLALVPDMNDSTYLMVAAVDSTQYDPMYAVTYNYSFTWYLKMNRNGDTISTKKGATVFRPNAAIKSPDGNLLLCGSVSGTGNTSIASILKCSLSGDSIFRINIKRNDNNYAVSLSITPDGNILCAGTSNNNPYSQQESWLICYDSLGDSLWCVSFQNRNRNVYSVASLSDSRFALFGGGVPDGSAGNHCLWLVQGGKNGEVYHENFYGCRTNEYAKHLGLLANGYLALGSYEYFNATFGLLIKTSPGGSLLWKKRIGKPLYQLVDQTASSWLLGAMDSTGFHLIETDTSGQILTDVLIPDTTHHYYETCIKDPQWGYYLVSVVNWQNGCIYRLDNNKHIVWSRQYAGSFFYSAVQTQNRNLVLLTESNSLMSIDTSGNILWQHYYPPPASYEGGVHGDLVVQTNNGGYTVFSGIGSGPNHSFIIRTDPNGNKLWEKIYENKAVWGLSVRVVNDNQYVIGGSTVGNNDCYIACLDSSAQFIWEKIYHDTLNGGITDFEVLPNGKIIALGFQNNLPDGDMDAFLRELGKKPAVSLIAGKNVAVKPELRLIKNSFILHGYGGKPQQFIARLYALNGACIYKTVGMTGNVTPLPDAHRMNAGVAILQVFLGNDMFKQKIIFVK